MKLPEPPESFIPGQLKVQRLAGLPLTLEHTLEAARLPWHHKSALQNEIRGPRGRANGRESRSENDDVYGEYDEFERRSIVAVQPAEARRSFCNAL